MMKYSEEALIHLTEASEGFSNKAYPDPGTGGKPWTIGRGHTKGVKEDDTCTEEQADIWIEEDLSEAEDSVNAYVKVPLTQSQFDALVDFVLNIGAEQFLSSTLLRKLNGQDYVGADAEFKRWIYGGGHIMPGLVKRREAEAEWFVCGRVVCNQTA